MRFSIEKTAAIYDIALIIGAIIGSLSFVIKYGISYTTLLSLISTVIIAGLYLAIKKKTLLSRSYYLIVFMILSFQMPYYQNNHLKTDLYFTYYNYVSVGIITDERTQLYLVLLIVLSLLLLALTGRLCERIDLSQLCKLADVHPKSPWGYIIVLGVDQILYGAFNYAQYKGAWNVNIPHIKGILHYSFEIIGLYCIFTLLEQLADIDKGIRLYHVLCLAVVKGIPGIITGSKSPVVFAFIWLMIFAVWNNNQLLDRLNPIWVALVLAVGFLSIQIGNYYRAGDFIDFAPWLFIRFTGYPDDVQTIWDILRVNGQTFSYLTYIKRILNLEPSVTLYATHKYTQIVSGAIARSCFCGALYYGFDGVIVILTYIFGTLFTVEKLGKDSNINVFSRGVCAFIFWYYLFFLVIDGNVDSIITIILPAIGTIMLRAARCVIERKLRKN